MDLIYFIVFFISMMVEEIDNVIMKKLSIRSFIKEKILFVSDEDSLLQCAQRCKFKDSDTKIDFRNSRCRCIRYETDDDKVQNQGTLTELFVNQKLMKMPAIDGGWGSWRNSTSCTKTCGNGTMIQVRDCDSPNPENGGNDCNGTKNRTIECSTHECPVDGRWSSWKDSTKCTKTCESGIKTQERECDSPRPEHGGGDCRGEQKRTVNCNNHGCKIVNVATGKEVKQSSTFADRLAIYGASNAIDGLSNTYSFTKREKNPWWEIDLFEVKKIVNIQLLISEDQALSVETRKNEVDAWNMCSNLGMRTASYSQPLKIKFQCKEQSTNARFIRIRYAIKDHPKAVVSIDEIEVFSYENN